MIEVGGTNLDQAMSYAEILEAPLIFAMNNSYCEAGQLYTNKPLYINENEVNELIRPPRDFKIFNRKYK